MKNGLILFGLFLFSLLLSAQTKSKIQVIDAKNVKQKIKPLNYQGNTQKENTILVNNLLKTDRAFYTKNKTWWPILGTPLQNPPEKTLRVRVIYVQNDEGGNNFTEDNPETLLLLDSMLGVANWSLYSPTETQEGCGTYYPWVTDSKIRLELVGVHFVQDSYGNAGPNYFYNALAGKKTNDKYYNLDKNGINKMADINIFFQEPIKYDKDTIPGVYSNHPAGYTAFPKTIVNKTDTQAIGIFLNGFYSNYLGMWGKVIPSMNEVCNFCYYGIVGEIIAHEVGHALGLPHYKRGCSNFCSNSNKGKQITLEQMGDMHKSMAFTNARKYVKEAKSDVPLLISKNEYWNFDIRLYRDIIIDTNQTLTLSPEARILLPENATITLKYGAKLIVNGAEISTEQNNKVHWQGIVIETPPFARKKSDQLYPGRVEIHANGKLSNVKQAIRYTDKKTALKIIKRR